MKRECAFSRLHPFTLLLWFITVGTITVFTMNPMFVFTSFLFSVIQYLCLDKSENKTRSLLSMIVFMILIAALNPIFSHHGVTVLFFLNDKPVTLEALLFGVMMSFAVASILLWCRLLSACLTTDKMIFLCGSLFPGLAVLISVTLRFIPHFKAQYKRIIDAQRGFGTLDGETAFKARISAFSALVTMVLEDSVDTADAMRARGAELRGRTFYSDFRFHRADLHTLPLIAAISAYLIFCVICRYTAFSFYPSVTKLLLLPQSAAAYCAFAVLSAMPIFSEVIFWTRLNLKT